MSNDVDEAGREPVVQKVLEFTQRYVARFPFSPQAMDSEWSFMAELNSDIALRGGGSRKRQPQVHLIR